MRFYKNVFYSLLRTAFIVLIYLNSTPFFGQDIKENVRIVLSFTDNNDLKSITAAAINKDNLPVEDLELFFYVQRTFSLLPIGDYFNSTDENGLAVVEFPGDLPGDKEGNVVIIVQVKESDVYNDLSIETTKKWGIPVKTDPLEEKRSIRAAGVNARTILITVVSLIILSVWYIICYIIFKLYKISKMKPLIK